MRTIALLIASNVFMTFAWYGHLRNLCDKPLVVAVLVSWGIALEGMLRLPLAKKNGMPSNSLVP